MHWKHNFIRHVIESYWYSNIPQTKFKIALLVDQKPNLSQKQLVANSSSSKLNYLLCYSIYSKLNHRP